MQALLDFDRWMFEKVNQGGANDFFDVLMPFLRQPLFWAPLYAFVIFLVLFNFRKHLFYWLLFGTVTLTITDVISSRFFKPLVGRLRPCNEPLLAEHIRVLAGCGMNGSFTSSHAANHFGISMFFFMTLHHCLGKKWSSLFFLWAISVCYAQVYVGVHYPLDVAGGALLGTLAGIALGKVFNEKIGLLRLN